MKWAYSQNIVEQTINNQSLETSVREKTYTAVTADTTYTLKGISENDVEKSKSVSVKFYNGIYYGKSNSSSYNAALINSFTKVLSDSKARTVTVNAGSGEYIFIVYLLDLELLVLMLEDSMEDLVKLLL